MKCNMMYCNGGYNYGEATFKDGKWEGVTICPTCNGTGEVASEPVEFKINHKAVFKPTDFRVKETSKGEFIVRHDNTEVLRINKDAFSSKGCIEVKQMTIEELREQFHSYSLEMSDELSDDFIMSPNFKDWLEMWSEENWKTYIACARANNIIKEKL